MEKILFVNACVRKESRTLRLAEHLLGKLDGEVETVNLSEENMPAFSCFDMIVRRDSLVRTGNTAAPELKYARQFASADTIVIAAPYWDLAFPAILKIYMEHVTVVGMTFRYSIDDTPIGMCKAHRLIYVTTSGGAAVFNMGYDYISTLCRSFFGIKDIMLFMAENLDIVGSDPEKIMASSLASIDKAADEGRLDPLY